MTALQERVFATRVPQAADISVQALDDRRRRVLQTICAPIFGAGGEVRSIAGIGRDVTDAREARNRCARRATVPRPPTTPRPASSPRPATICASRCRRRSCWPT
jgi:hypothetical protein